MLLLNEYYWSDLFRIIDLNDKDTVTYAHFAKMIQNLVPAHFVLEVSSVTSEFDRMKRANKMRKGR